MSDYMSRGSQVSQSALSINIDIESVNQSDSDKVTYRAVCGQLKTGCFRIISDYTHRFEKVAELNVSKPFGKGIAIALISEIIIIFGCDSMS